MPENIESTLLRVAEVFHLEGEYLGYREIKVGHINETYELQYLRGGEKVGYVAQRINMYVFKNPRIMMRNIDLVTRHIREKEPSAAMHFHHTASRENFWIMGGAFWRVSTLIPGIGIEDGAGAAGMRSAGRAFGLFQNYLADFDASLLQETIPDFHHTRKRFDNLFRTVIDDPCSRVRLCREELYFVQSVRDLSCKITALWESGEMPMRVTHNDTKTNNVILDADTLEPRCVVDLDTVMPGLIVYDFGDAIRYGANTSAEDERDLSRVALDAASFRAFAEGFIGTTAPTLTEIELDNMALGAVTMTMECGVRFLDDYLSGDKYFKIDYPEQNLDRARCQFALARNMIARLPEMNAIVREIYAKVRR